MNNKPLYTITWRQLYNYTPSPQYYHVDVVELALNHSNFAEAKAVIEQIKSKL